MRNVCAGLFVILAIATRAGASTIAIADITDGGQNADHGANPSIFNNVGQAVDAVRWGWGNSPAAGSAVPEPASLVLMGTGMALLARRLRRRSR
jgi:hypothetical protein